MQPEEQRYNRRDSSINENAALELIFRLEECTVVVVRERELAVVERGRLKFSDCEEEGVEACRVRVIWAEAVYLMPMMMR